MKYKLRRIRFRIDEIKFYQCMLKVEYQARIVAVVGDRMPEVKATHINNLSIESETNKYDEFIVFIIISHLFCIAKHYFSLKHNS
ncbi:hypothetical protein SADUNF_Sadunf19G0038700 [Salix dunnii]|uniref:Uncharacterized protein n=1 Tax=Salix dunnii TaxID=1413687 RepID=A0A835MF29_9ROSI|nr:hypothetical protein SADUNF_Sadunf19G0038700 [Salix dunnii]